MNDHVSRKSFTLHVKKNERYNSIYFSKQFTKPYEDEFSK